MLNISPNSVLDRVDQGRFGSFSKTDLVFAHRMFVRWLIIAMVLFIVFMFLPWTQNVQSEGKVNILNPSNRPQTVHSTIAGRIEKWFVQEGDSVSRGDTLLFLSEIKSEYFDPDLVLRTGEQVGAKEGSVQAYRDKIDALDRQIVALGKERDLKIAQLKNKIQQARFKIAADSIDLEQAQVAQVIADTQYLRAVRLFERDIAPRKAVENARNKQQEALAKEISANNKLLGSKNELINAQLALEEANYSYAEKIAKIESDRQATYSQLYEATGQVSKMRIDLANYEQRSQFYFITAPQDGIITQALTMGIGETVKEQEAVASIMPTNYQLAVEMYVKPMDLPLLQRGQEVRFLFDGWPAIVFSGWPGFSFGTFTGKIFAIDNIPNNKGEYRILVAPDEEKGPEWPVALRPGGGARGIALLNNVPLWYELWRQLNGFPPDYYEGDENMQPKLKAPAKSIK